MRDGEGGEEEADNESHQQIASSSTVNDMLYVILDLAENSVEFLSSVSP